MASHHSGVFVTPDTTGLAPMGRCFFLPKNHGIPLAVAFQPEHCRSGAAFKNYCVEFTGLPEAVYQWMDDNPLLDMWLNGCYVADTWTAWKGLESQAAFDTFRHPELVLRSRLLWDHLLHTLDGHWPDKLQQLGSHAMTIFDQSPDIAPFHSTRMDDMWYLPGLLNIKTQSWIKNFEIAFQKTDLPAWLNEFVRVDIAATLSVEGLAQLKILSKHTQAKELTPAHNTHAARRPPPTALLSAMIRDRFQSEATSPPQVKQHASQQTETTAKHSTPDEELDWQRRDRKRKQSGGPSIATQLDYRKHGHWEDSDDSVEVTGVRKPPTHPATPPRVQQRQRNRVNTETLSTSGLHLPFEQIRTGITPYFPGHAQTSREPVGHCLLPTVDDIDDPFMFNRTKYVVGTLNATMGLLAHFGAYAVPPTIRMGPTTEEARESVRNIGWWLHLVFHFPSRYKNLRDISAELSPFLLASPLAGHLFWFIEHLSHHPTQQAWMRLRPALRLRVTAAAFIGLQHLFKVFTDWAQNYFPDEHCVPLLLWSYPERSDVCAFDSAIRMRDWKTLKEELTVWRSECEAAFNVNVFTSTADSPATFYSRPLPADVMPIRPPPVLHHQQQHQPPARPLRPLLAPERGPHCGTF
ncbi:hypothetical protein MPSEU_000806900 [Mayamaea pseudoterrestris]|nr:hypothetical protein MPSEU_000806900 [Mayamaea pseudoterrestris]